MKFIFLLEGIVKIFTDFEEGLVILREDMAGFAILLTN